MNQCFENNTAYEVPRFKGLTFDLKHFASKVTYDVEGWVEKNKDTFYEDLIKCMQKSNNDLVKSLFPENEIIINKGKLHQTTSQKFREEVNSLLVKLKHKRQHFVKCIKPNHEKKPQDFVDDIVLDQVRYLGLCETVQVRKAGFYFKMPYDKFLNRYKLCSNKTWPKFVGAPKDGCECILKDMDIQGYALGKTKVFLRSPIHVSLLDEKIQSRKNEMAKLVQDAYRKFRTRKVNMESELLTKALEQTYGEKGPFAYKQVVNQIDVKGERTKVMLVVAPKAMYTLDPKSFAVLRRIPLEKVDKLMCSALPDGVFVVSSEKQYDTIFEADNKSAAMKAIRDTHETLYQQKVQLRVDINSDFQFSPKRGTTKQLKFTKNYGVKNTFIEVTPDGLDINVKPSDDVFDGKKLRRKNSFNKKYFGDYIRLQNSDLMKQIEKDYGDKHVLFSGIVGKYNKKYKRQDRILMITERAVYNLDPNGYLISMVFQ